MQIHGSLMEYIKQNDTTIKMFDRRMHVCQMKYKRNSRDFVFVLAHKITEQFTNFSTCPILPDTYVIRNVVMDSKVIPGFVSLPDKNFILSANYCEKRKNKKDLCFLSGVARFRYFNN